MVDPNTTQFENQHWKKPDAQSNNQQVLGILKNRPEIHGNKTGPYPDPGTLN